MIKCVAIHRAAASFYGEVVLFLKIRTDMRKLVKIAPVPVVVLVTALEATETA